MKAMKAGVTKAGKGIDNLVWNILGQTYVPKHLTESSFSWHALLPPGTFVPPHIHANQDEFIYVLEGKFDLILDGKDATATAGDFIRAGAAALGVGADLVDINAIREGQAALITERAKQFIEIVREARAS